MASSKKVIEESLAKCLDRSRSGFDWAPEHLHEVATFLELNDFPASARQIRIAQHMLVDEIFERFLAENN